jgi:hypothetical protein
VTASTLSLDVADVEALLARIEPLITKADHECLKSLVGTLLEVTRLARQRGATIARLRRMLGQTSSEKKANVVGANTAAAPASDGGPAPSGQDESVADSPSGKPKDTPANDTGGDKPRRKGHGRIPGSAYASESIAVPHPTLCAGQPRPACAHGTLYTMNKPASCVRVFGQTPLVALRWDCACLRCSGCGQVFTAPLPKEARGPKYSESAASMMIVLRYGMGVPLNRLETMQRFLGVPVPASTQWEVARDLVQEVLPVYDVLVSIAANAPIVHNDDTYVRILALMGKRRDKLIAAGALDLPDRTGLFTTGIVARTASGPIALFASGRSTPARTSPTFSTDAILPSPPRCRCATGSIATCPVSTPSCSPTASPTAAAMSSTKLPTIRSFASTCSASWARSSRTTRPAARAASPARRASPSIRRRAAR